MKYMTKMAAPDLETATKLFKAVSKKEINCIN